MNGIQSLKLGLIRSHTLHRLQQIALNKPEYQHDCDTCKFLGRNENGYDLYICKQLDNPTVIARFSSEPSDYKSGLSFVGFDSDLSDAYRLAVVRKLIS